MDYKSTHIPATGNGMKASDRYDMFLTVSGGDGNRDPVGEVHLVIQGNDGEFAQGWFSVADLLRAIGDATPYFAEMRG